MSHIYEAMRKAELALTSKGAVAAVLDVAPAEVIEQGPIADQRPDFSAITRPPGAPPIPQFRIEDVAARCSHPQWLSRETLGISSDALASHEIREQFGTLASLLQQFARKRPLQTVLITSSIPGEGKTFITGNLAQTIVAQGNRSVLVIDADLRSGGLHGSLGAPCQPGLAEYLAGAADEMAVIQQGRKEKLFFIPRGEPSNNPIGLFSNGRLKALLKRVGPAFDWIFLDCPACLPFADAGTIAGFCDGVLLVVKAGVPDPSSQSLIQKACEELRPANLIGKVLNAPASLNHASKSAASA